MYGEPEYVPLDENHRLQAINPYGRTKASQQLIYVYPDGNNPEGEVLQTMRNSTLLFRCHVQLFIEEILRDVCKAEKDISCILLRYFNPVGAHPSGRIGESPVGIPNNLMPFVQQVWPRKLCLSFIARRSFPFWPFFRACPLSPPVVWRIQALSILAFSAGPAISLGDSRLHCSQITSRLFPSSPPALGF